jgi:hypothetical protein
MGRMGAKIGNDEEENMEKDKFYINCVRFYSTSNPCPNKNNEYISSVFRAFTPKNPVPSRPYIVKEDIIKLANEICRSCESFELIEK